MMRLTKVELRRLFSRRLTSIALLGALVITGLMLFSTFQQAKPLSGADLISQRAQFDQAHKDWVANGAQRVPGLLEGAGRGPEERPYGQLGVQPDGTRRRPTAWDLCWTTPGDYANSSPSSKPSPCDKSKTIPHSQTPDRSYLRALLAVPIVDRQLT
jgi:hypothetical protein